MSIRHGKQAWLDKPPNARRGSLPGYSSGRKRSAAYVCGSKITTITQPGNLVFRRGSQDMPFTNRLHERWCRCRHPSMCIQAGPHGVHGHWELCCECFKLLILKQGGNHHSRRQALLSLPTFPLRRKPLWTKPVKPQQNARSRCDIQERQRSRSHRHCSGQLSS